MSGGLVVLRESWKVLLLGRFSNLLKVKKWELQRTARCVTQYHYVVTQIGSYFLNFSSDHRLFWGPRT